MLLVYLQKHNANSMQMLKNNDVVSNIYCLLIYSFTWTVVQDAYSLFLCSRLELCSLLHEKLSLDEFEAFIYETNTISRVFGR